MQIAPGTDPVRPGNLFAARVIKGQLFVRSDAYLEATQAGIIDARAFLTEARRPGNIFVKLVSPLNKCRAYLAAHSHGPISEPVRLQAEMAETATRQLRNILKGPLHSEKYPQQII